ncbi:MAG: SNF2-related protein [Bacteroidota bacterium]
MVITRTKEVFRIEFKYNPRLVDGVKELPQRRFDPVNKCWTVPLSFEKEIANFANRYNFKFGSQVDEEKYFDVSPLPELNQEIPLKMKLFPYQANGVAYAIEKKRVIIGDQPGLGKAQPLNAKIATPAGFIEMKDIYVNCPVSTPDSSIAYVTGVFPQGIRPVYKVTFNDGYSTECDEEHLWTIRDHNQRRRNSGWQTKTLKEIIASGVEQKNSPSRIASGRKPVLKWEVPITKPVFQTCTDYIIPPYIIGVLIGDGSLTNNHVCFSSPDFDDFIVNKVEAYLPENLKLWVNRNVDCPQYFITQNKTTKKNPWYKEIENLKLNVKSIDKFIPQFYLQLNANNRLQLLRGLMDTDGSCFKNRSIFHTMSLRLAENLVQLVQSLGGLANINTYDRTKEFKGIEYQVCVSLNECPFSLPRKANQWREKSITRFIEKIEYLRDDYTQCIKISSKEELYLTDNYIVTHNTAQAIATAVAVKAKCILTICPSSLKINWEREWKMWSNYKPMILTDNVKHNFHLFHQTGLVNVFIVNFESLKKYFVQSISKTEGGKLTLKNITFKKQFTDMFDMVIIDESHRCKSTATRQSKLVKGICTGKEYIYCLTGTPVINKPKDLISQLGIIDQMPAFGGYKNFVMRYCNGPNEASNLRELNYVLTQNCFYRRDKQEVLKDLPDKLRQIALCEISTRKEYTDAERDMVEYLYKYKDADDEKVARVLRGEIMVKIGILKNVSARGKIADVCEFVDDILDSGEKLVLFCHLREVIHEFKKAYPKAVTITGEDDNAARQSAIDSFQTNPKTQLIICSIKAAGVGLTLTAASRVAFVELPWTAADCDQCEDRVHRIGQKDSVTATYFLGNNTIDEKIYKIIQAKRDIAKQITGSQEQIEESIVDLMFDLFTKPEEVSSEK